MPAPPWTHWDEHAEALHGISRAIAVRMGIDTHEACQQLNRALGGKQVYTDGSEMDRYWMQRLFDGSPQTHALFELLDLFNQVDPQFYADCAALLHDAGKPHRALADAQLIAGAVRQLMQKGGLR